MSASRVRIRNALLAAIPLIAGFGWFFSAGTRATPVPVAVPGVPVVVAPVVARDVPFWADGIGTVTPLQEVVLRSRVTGVLAEVLFSEGQFVHKGTLLARIDDRQFVAALMQAQAEKLRSEAQLGAAERDLERYQSLQEAIPRQTLDQQAATVSQMRAAVRANEAQVAAAEVQLSYTRIVAPISGRVGLRRIDPGNLVQASDAQGLVTVTQIDPVSVVFTLPQHQLPQFRHLIKPDGQPSARVSALDRDHGLALGEGRLTMIDNTIDAATGMIRLRAEFANGGAQLWPGQFVTTRLHTGTREDALVVPCRSVRQGIDGSFVFRIVRHEDGRDRAEMVAVQPSYRDEEIAVIPQGLAAGDRVVIDGHSRLKPGTAVSLIDAPPSLMANLPPAGR